MFKYFVMSTSFLFLSLLMKKGSVLVLLFFLCMEMMKIYIITFVMFNMDDSLIVLLMYLLF